MNEPPSTIPSRGHLLTEQRLAASANLDALSIEQTLALINAQDATVAGVVSAAIPAIGALVGDVVAAMRGGGRLIYIGAGTSGRLGVLDASECPPTFFCDASQVVGLIAGGDTALRNSSETAEDNPLGAREALAQLAVGERDVVVGIAAGGTTPYVLGAIDIAKSCGAITALICCIDAKHLSQLKAHSIDHMIELLVGPEVLTGSTRMKAGTATKLALNMISTSTMVQLGKAWGNLMVDLRAANVKLRDRAARIITAQCDLSRDEAMALLDCAGGRVKLALVMAKCNVDAEAAQQLLDQHDGKLRPIVGPPR